MKPLHWLVILSLLAVFVAPPTRRAAFEQTRLVLGVTPPQAFLFPASTFRPNPAGLELRRADDFRRAAARRPNDIGLQMAAPVASLPFSITEFNKAVVAGLRPLLATHPKTPAVYAQLLQYGSACLDDVGDEYKAAKPEFQPLRDAIDPKPAHPLPRVTFADYDAWAAAGERLDPRNGFFPAMRAVGYHDRHRSADALLAMKRAATKDRWEQYDSDLAAAEYFLPREVYGRTDPFVVSGFVTMMESYAALREALYRTTLDASSAAERAGRMHEGLRIRRSAWRLARLWRLHSRSVIGAMSSYPVTLAAIEELGGHVKRDPRLTSAQRRAATRKVILAYLRRTGHFADADYLRRDMAQRDAMHDIISKGLERADVVGTMTKAMFSWCGAAILLNAALWLTLMGAMAIWVRGAATDRHKRRALAAIAFTVVLLAWQGRAQEGWLAQAPYGVVPFFLGWLSAAIAALAVPLLLAILMGLTALVRRKPFRKTTGGWLRASLLPTACVVALLFVGASVWGVKPQREWKAYRAAQLASEGRYYAHLLGKTWPE